MPAVRQKRPKQASTACHASSMRGVTENVRDVVVLVMALLSLKESAPGAYGLGASNARLPISTSIGTSPDLASKAGSPGAVVDAILKVDYSDRGHEIGAVIVLNVNGRPVMTVDIWKHNPHIGFLGMLRALGSDVVAQVERTVNQALRVGRGEPIREAA